MSELKKRLSSIDVMNLFGPEFYNSFCGDLEEGISKEIERRLSQYSFPMGCFAKKRQLLDSLEYEFYRTLYTDLEDFNDEELEFHWANRGIQEGRFGSAQHVSSVLDTEFYRTFYPDLAEFSDEKLHTHWLRYGIKEGRYGNLLLLAKAKGSLEAFSKLDVGFYLSCNSDLTRKGISSPLEAQTHFFCYGFKENRISNFSDWIRYRGLDEQLFQSDVFNNFINRASKNDYECDLKTILKIIDGSCVLPKSLDPDRQRSLSLYKKLSEVHILNKTIPAAKKILRAAIILYKDDPDLYELLGNVLFEEKYYDSAAAYYEKSLSLESKSRWCLENLIRCYRHTFRYKDAILRLMELPIRQTGWTHCAELLDEVCAEYWDEMVRKISSILDFNSREAALKATCEMADFIYEAYAEIFGSYDLPELRQLNTEKILIVGDYHVPQCVRYRIDQKVEQLEDQGKEVNTVDWLKLAENQNEIALFGTVIFYRVPAVPQVLKAMAQVNSMGTLSIYEIDDLIFDSMYPPPLETYGGFVDIGTYHELAKGMALNHAAARHCRIGMVSTFPLARKLEPLVIEKKCLVHRNGLDSLNNFKAYSECKQGNSIDIFYGSGTKAHNSDFLEQALPALTRILKNHSNARLVVMGYLELPKSFIIQFKEQLLQIPAVSNVEAYWYYLEKADINIAVLLDDEINACKSELKWFEAACFSVPSVLSSTENYRDVIEDGVDAFIAADTDEWYSALDSLIRDPLLRKQVGETAMARIRNEYSPGVLGERLVQSMDSYRKKTVSSVDSAKKKVALVNVFFAPQSIGGATRVVEDNFEVMVDEYADQYEICIFTADAEQRPEYQLKVYTIGSIPVYRVTTKWKENMEWDPKDPEMYKIFSKFLDLEQPDIVHFHCMQRLTGSVVEATKDRGICYIITIHDAWWISDFQFLVDHNGTVYPEGHPDPYEKAALPPGITLEDSIERRCYLFDLMRNAKHLLTVSDSFAQLYKKNGIRGVVTSKNGISQKIDWRTKETSYTDKVVCALIGGMSEHKGYKILKEAACKGNFENVEFLIVDHSNDSSYRGEDYWGSSSVTIIGKVKQNDIVGLYTKIDVLFAPSIWPESFGLVTREAAACSCWIVASSLGGIGDDVLDGENGFVIEPTVAALVDVLGRIEAEPKIYKKPAPPVLCFDSRDQVKDVVRYYR